MIRVDGNEIRIQLYNVAECDAILNNLNSFGVVIGELVQNHKDVLILMGENYSIYQDWWNNKIVPELKSMTWCDDDIFKWNQLVRQEIEMWIRLNRPVGLDEVTWMSDRRGFSPKQRMVLVEGLKLVGLYTENNTMHDTYTLDKMDDEATEAFSKQVGM